MNPSFSPSSSSQRGRLPTWLGKCSLHGWESAPQGWEWDGAPGGSALLLAGTLGQCCSHSSPIPEGSLRVQVQTPLQTSVGACPQHSLGVPRFPF